MENLEKICKQMRIDIIEMIAAAGSGHPGGSLSACDMIATLFFEKMNIDPSRPNWEDRDRFVLSKGHVAPALYAALAERGYIPREDLLSLRKMIVFTATPKSTLADMSDCSIVIQAPSKKQDDSAFQSIQPMASLFEQGILLVGDSIVLTMMEHASNNTEMFNRHSNLE